MCWRLGQTYSFMQISTSLDLRQTEAVQFIKDLSKKQNAPALAQLASRIASAMKLSHGDDVFAKIKGMVSDMIENFEQEAAESAELRATRKLSSRPPSRALRRPSLVTTSAGSSRVSFGKSLSFRRTLRTPWRSTRPLTWRKRRLWRRLRRRIALGSRATSTLAVRRGRLRLMGSWRPRTPWLASAAMTVMISCETS